MAVIPARYASTRFPGKPLAPIMGRSLVEHVYFRTRQASSVERVVVATDDVRIMEAVRGFGGECVMTSGDHRSGSDRIGEVTASLDADVIINVQGDEPLIEPEVIDAVVGVHQSGKGPDISTLAVPIEKEEDYSSRNVVKVVTDNRGYALYFSRSAIPHGWEPGSGNALRHIGIYAFSREALLTFVSLPAGKLEKIEDLEQLRAMENGMSILVVRREEHRSIGVDRPEDIEKVEVIMRELEALPGDPAADGTGRRP